jgi:hypothetical protein
MPSLIPKTKIEIPEPPDDFEEILTSEAYAASRSRVIAYIKHFEDGFSKKTMEETRRPDFVTERFEIAMPTQEAYLAEIELCAAVKAHQRGELTDAQLKTVCDGYIASHTVCYQGGKTPWAKVGDYHFWTWHNVPLYYVNSSIFDGWTCNAIQVLVLKQIYSDRQLGDRQALENYENTFISLKDCLLDGPDRVGCGVVLKRNR